MTKSHKKTNKLITAIIVAIMLCNFVMPNLAFAATDTKNGGKLMDYIAKFLCFIPDAVINKLQDMFVSVEKIDETVDEEGNTKYKILYSPGIIFSGTVPVLDINFIGAQEKDETKKSSNNITYQVMNITANNSRNNRSRVK